MWGRRIVLMVAVLSAAACGSDSRGVTSTTSKGYGIRVWSEIRLARTPKQVVITFDGPDPSGGARCAETYDPHVNPQAAGVRQIMLQVPNPMAPSSCPTKRIELAVEVGTLRDGDVIAVGYDGVQYRLQHRQFSVVPSSTPCGRTDCSTPSPTPAPCATAAYLAAVAQIDGGIRLNGEPRCDGSFLVADIDSGSSGCAPTDGAGASACARSELAYFVARDARWSLVTYAEGLDCTQVAVMTTIRFPAALCR